MAPHRHQLQSPTLLLIAVSVLVLGVLVYISARAPGSTLFLPSTWSAGLPWPGVFLTLAGCLPTFFHTLGFCLILTVIAGRGRRTATWVCTAWFGVEAAFEAGQHPLISAWLMAQLPQGDEQMWLVAYIVAYFINGVFDPLDIAAAAAGAVLAMLLVVANKPSRGHGHEQHS